MAMSETVTPWPANHCRIWARVFLSASMAKRVVSKGAILEGLAFIRLFIFVDHDTVWEKCTLAANTKCNVTLHPIAVCRTRHMRLPDSRIRKGQFHAETRRRGPEHGIILAQNEIREETGKTKEGHAETRSARRRAFNRKDHIEHKKREAKGIRGL